MKKKLLTVLGVIMIVCCVTACGSNEANQADRAEQPTESTEATADEQTTEIKTYEFETFDGETVVINEGNIVSQEACEEPLEWDGLPAEATQLAPGRDFILFGDETNYYVEDAENKLVTIAFKELGDVIEETDFAIFDNDVFSFQYDPDYFMVVETDESVTVSFYNEEVQTAGSNVIIFTKQENTDAMSVVNTCMERYGATEDERVENYLGGDDVKGYSYSTGNLESPDSELKTCETFHAVPCGEDVILIDKLRTLGSDMDLENSLDAQLDEVILTFQLD